jgi:transcriptional regulator with PAS, ATPase and Fis domain
MSESSGTKVEVVDIETAVRSNYVSMSKAAEAMGVTTAALTKRFKKTNCFILKGRYQVEKK